MAAPVFTPKVAAEIAATLALNGFPGCQPADVEQVVRYGSVDEGVIGPEYDEALTDAILDALDDHGIEVA